MLSIVATPEASLPMRIRNITQQTKNSIEGEFQYNGETLNLKKTATANLIIYCKVVGD
ncbi:hypothetical protein J27TS8_32850 [Robertmurraya siralis]|uniref:Uncharacterized protein n=1 Tax=Robertmurraya siralis TaxID=77777 RepID=A0A920BVE2_9BACI|nr:hypothetical protein J27TS8_32850 [Robertmurraya siralis]